MTAGPAEDPDYGYGVAARFAVAGDAACTCHCSHAPWTLHDRAGGALVPCACRGIDVEAGSNGAVSRAARLAAHCGYVPLILMVVAGVMKAQQSKTQVCYFCSLPGMQFEGSALTAHILLPATFQHARMHAHTSQAVRAWAFEETWDMCCHHHLLCTVLLSTCVL